MKIVFLLLSLIVICETKHGFCGHDMLQKELIYAPPESVVQKSKLTTTERPFVIYMDYYSINNEHVVSDSYIENVKTLLDEVKIMFEQIVLAIDNPAILKFTNESVAACDSKFTVNPEVEKGVNADLIITPIVTSELPEGVVAAAGACYLLKTTGRPIYGIIYVGKDYDFSNAEALKYVKTVLVHEATHIFVFSSGLYERFNNNGATIIKEKKVNGVNRVLLTSDKVVKAARKHFGCNSLDGVELENQGGSGSVGSHWEARIMLGDYMISTVYTDIVFSEITLALFEDSGWYKVNYYTGGLFRFGKGEGCKFLNTKCVQDGEIMFPKEYCTFFEQSCFTSHRDRGFCPAFKITEGVPEEYQYFDDPYLGGFRPADFCPVRYLSISEDGVYYPNNCQDGIEFNDSASRDEVIGPNSICVDSTLNKNTEGSYRGTCYPIKCYYDTKQFDITIGSQTVKCGEGAISQQTVEGYKGSIICPDFSRVCTSETWCTDMFDCVNKKALPIDAQSYQSVSLLCLISFLITILF